ncbi:hypothetical protein SS50377_20503 [Spironucleus salmonicida]|uniref:Uncharacterized protein n=1 Tax=Spironucleus salmonicida TaxID=348837 RepID=V6LGZ9_9EUKA|nr:hypothetical protein SS50377_20503 [Spironucleus salmonicida]|eukprot:EST43797.1 Hypothetical protein SS50377_16415 [Spironucleus salmonicida]
MEKRWPAEQVVGFPGLDVESVEGLLGIRKTEYVFVKSAVRVRDKLEFYTGIAIQKSLTEKLLSIDTDYQIIQFMEEDGYCFEFKLDNFDSDACYGEITEFFVSKKLIISSQFREYYDFANNIIQIFCGVLKSK